MQLPQVGPCTILAIDGCGGAGKSTLARKLQQAWSGSVIVETDDFASWDNPVDWWPRMLEQVLVPLSRGESTRYQQHNWVENRLDGWVNLYPGLIIIEGVTSSRKEFRPYLSASIWVETPRDLRLRRGLDRDGDEMEEQWLKWMAVEDTYIQEHRPHGFARWVISGET